MNLLTLWVFPSLKRKWFINSRNLVPSLNLLARWSSTFFLFVIYVKFCWTTATWDASQRQRAQHCDVSTKLICPRHRIEIAWMRNKIDVAFLKHRHTRAGQKFRALCNTLNIIGQPFYGLSHPSRYTYLYGLIMQTFDLVHVKPCQCGSYTRSIIKHLASEEVRTRKTN